MRICAQLHAIAPEFYNGLAYHTSWSWVTWTFLTDAEVGPWTRVRRRQRGGDPSPATPLIAEAAPAAPASAALPASELDVVAPAARAAAEAARAPVAEAARAALGGAAAALFPAKQACLTMPGAERRCAPSGT